MVATPKMNLKTIVELWASFETNYKEADLAQHFMTRVFDYLEIDHHQIKNTPNIGSGLIPDYLIYNDLDRTPILVIEIKGRDPVLAGIDEAKFTATCKEHPLYTKAVGLPEKPNNNGIVQYLDVRKVKPDYLASYGLVFNGDFFQLWRRVDGLVIPMTMIRKVTKASLPKLLKELAKCLKNPGSALVAAIWNSKGGVSKTTNTINVAACLALAGKRVLLIDLDPQNDLTSGLGLTPNYAPNYFDLAYDQLCLQQKENAKEILEKSIQTKSYHTTDRKKFNLSLLNTDKGHLQLINEGIKRAHDPYKIFNSLFKLIQYDYDYIFIDASPKFDEIGRSLLCTADIILIPIDLGAKSLKHGIELSNKLIPGIQAMRDKADDFTVGPWSLGLLSSNCPAHNGIEIEKLIANMLVEQGFTGKQVRTKLINYAQVKQAEFQEKPVVCWHSSRITKLFHELTTEVFLGHNYSNN